MLLSVHRASPENPVWEAMLYHSQFMAMPEYIASVGVYHSPFVSAPVLVAPPMRVNVADNPLPSSPAYTVDSITRPVSVMPFTVS